MYDTLSDHDIDQAIAKALMADPTIEMSVDASGEMIFWNKTDVAVPMPRKTDN